MTTPSSNSSTSSSSFQGTKRKEEAYHSVFARGLFHNHVVLITGGGTGLGRCIAHELAWLGATVVIAARREGPLQQTCQEIQAVGGRASWCVVNIRDEDSVDRLVQTVLQRHGRLDGLVNNAGGQFFAPAESVTVRGFQTVLELNTVGTWRVTRAAFHQWMKDHGGTIVQVIADYWTGFPGMLHTGAARAGVDNLTRTLCREWAQYGIRINSVAPGTIISSGMQNYPPPVQEHIALNYHNKNPSGRLGTEAEVSSAVVWLLSPGSQYVNGTCVRVDGGSSLSKASLAPYPEKTALPAYMGYGNAEWQHRDLPPRFQTLLQSYETPPPRSRRASQPFPFGGGGGTSGGGGGSGQRRDGDSASNDGNDAKKKTNASSSSSSQPRTSKL